MQTSVTGGSSVRTPMAYADYLARGETKHTEYYDGMCVVNPPNKRHVLAEMALRDALVPHCPAGYVVYQEWGWHIAARVEVLPDLMVAPLDAPGDDQLRVAPLLVVEISSPSTRDVDHGRKRTLYGDAGAPWYWVVDLDAAQITVLQNIDGRFVDVQHIAAGGAVTAGPFAVHLDPATLGRPSSTVD
jgi:putative restriction endonuclease